MTALLERTVGEIAADLPGTGQIFENHHIDYCCGGKRRLRDACRAAGVNADVIEAEILAISEITGETSRCWKTEPLEELIQFIVEVHHAYLRDELPSLDRLLVNLEYRYGSSHPEIPPLRRSLLRLTEELQAHMKKEETVLFPAILRIERAFRAGQALPVSAFGSVRNPIWMMEQEHDIMASILAEFRTLTENYTLRDQQCEMFCVVANALQLLETDLHEHLHLENNILFPRALQLEAQLRAPK